MVGEAGCNGEMAGEEGCNAGEEVTDESDNACCRIITYNNLINGSINASVSANERQPRYRESNEFSSNERPLKCSWATQHMHYGR
jgi:hypothetical protein